MTDENELFDELFESNDDSISLLALETGRPFWEPVKTVARYYRTLWRRVWWPAVRYYRKIVIGVTLFLAIAGPVTLWLLERRSVPVANLIWAGVIPIVVLALIAFIASVIAAPARLHAEQNHIIGDHLQAKSDLQEEKQTADERRGLLDHLGRLLTLGRLTLPTLEHVSDEIEKVMQEARQTGETPPEVKIHDLLREGSKHSREWKKSVSNFLGNWLDYSYVARFEDDSGLAPGTPPAKMKDGYFRDLWVEHDFRLQRLHQIIKELNDRWAA